MNKHRVLLLLVLAAVATGYKKNITDGAAGGCPNATSPLPSLLLVIMNPSVAQQPAAPNSSPLESTNTSQDTAANPRILEENSNKPDASEEEITTEAELTLYKSPTVRVLASRPNCPGYEQDDSYYDYDSNSDVFSADMSIKEEETNTDVELTLPKSPTVRVSASRSNFPGYEQDDSYYDDDSVWKDLSAHMPINERLMLNDTSLKGENEMIPTPNHFTEALLPFLCKRLHPEQSQEVDVLDLSTADDKPCKYMCMLIRLLLLRCPSNNATEEIAKVN